MNIRKFVTLTPSKLSIWKPGVLILFTILGLSMSYLLTGCKQSEGQANQPPGKAITVTFDLLSGYDYDKDQIPEIVRILSGQRVAVTGFMLATMFDQGKIKHFLLLRNQMGCCFGIRPQENEFVDVKMRGNSYAKYMPDVLVTVVGELEVGEKLPGSGVYNMEADNVVVLGGF